MIKRVGKICAIIFIVLATVFSSFAMKKIRSTPLLRLDKQKLLDIAGSWFPDLAKNSKDYKTCWKTVFTILSEKLENDPGLQIHHTGHHILQKKGRQIGPLFPGDPHDVRISGDEKVIFNITVGAARNALVRRLQGYYKEYVPFAFSPSAYMEIPLAPEEEFSLLNSADLDFWHRNPQNPLEWARCGVRIKGIGVMLCEGGIISIFLATEFPELKVGGIRLMVPEGNKTGNTKIFEFNRIDDGSVSAEKIPDSLIGLSIQNLLGFEPRPFISQLKLPERYESDIRDIIENPLRSDFSFRVMAIRSLKEAGFLVALDFSKKVLEELLTKYSVPSNLNTPLFLSSLIMPMHIKPSAITLSHIFLDSPQITQNCEFKKLLSVADGNVASLQLHPWQINMANDVLLNAISRCETDADIFSIATLLAKSVTLK